jgi:hypothetical protein
MHSFFGAQRKFIVDDAFKLEQLHANARALFLLYLPLIFFLDTKSFEVIFDHECLQNSFSVCLLHIIG